MDIQDWRDMMPYVIYHAPVVSRDAYGKPSAYGTETSYKAYIQYTTKRVASIVTGQDVLSTEQVWIDGVIENLNADDKITFQDGSTPMLVSWDVVSDEHGAHHMRLYFGRT